MKIKHLLLFSVFVATFSACSNNDDNNTNTNSENSFLPLNVDDYWVYDVISEQMTNEDSIFVASEETLNGLNYSNFGTRDPFYGFYASAIKNNKVRKEGSQMFLTGSLNTAALGDFIDVPIVLNDFIFFNENGTLNQQLDMETGVIEQDLQGTPLNITYTLKSTSLGSLETFNAPNGTVYNNVKTVKVSLQLYVSTTFESDTLPIPITIAVLEAQDVLISTLYFVENIGVVYASTNYQYELNPSLFGNPLIPVPDLGIPTEASFVVTEHLKSYNIN